MSAYNFIGSWQVIPELCEYSAGVPPKSMILKIEEKDSNIELHWDWYTHDNQSLSTGYTIAASNDSTKPFDYIEVADEVSTKFTGSHHISIQALKGAQIAFSVNGEINNKGQLVLQQQGTDTAGNLISKKEVYHKQLSVLPYAHSVSGVAIVPTQQGVIKHKALQAMAEQTDMHLDQIRKQIELLALQANQIKRRKELSMLIYAANINFVPQIGQVYHLYEKSNGQHTLSLVAPSDWGGGAGPYKAHLGGVKLLADHTWTEIENGFSD
jgi:hypothetical protein